MQALLTAVGVGLIAASIIILTSEAEGRVPRAAVSAVFGTLSLLIGLTLPRRHRVSARRVSPAQCSTTSPRRKSIQSGLSRTGRASS